MVLIVLIMARTGFSGGDSPVSLFLDGNWLMITASCAYTIILAVIVLTYLLGDAIAIRTVSTRTSPRTTTFATSGLVFVKNDLCTHECDERKSLFFHVCLIKLKNTDTFKANSRQGKFEKRA